MRATVRTPVLGLAVAAALLVAPGSSVPVGSARAGTPATGRAKPVLELMTDVLTPRATGRLDVDTLGQHVCRLSFRGPGHRHAGPFLVRARLRHVQWRWRVPATVARGRWSATVACARSRPALAAGRDRAISERLTVRHGRRRGGGPIIARGSLRVHVSAAPPAGRAAPSGGRVVGLGAAGNPFPWGQCTFHAYEKRPDVYDYAITHGVPHTGLASSATYGGIPDYWWNAWRWLSNAQRAGIPTGTTPVVGALVVFPRGDYHSAVGHVAYVDAVYADGTYQVDERNWNGNPNVNLRHVYPGWPGVGFIYGGPAGNGPTPAPTPTPVPTPTPPFRPVYIHHVQGTCADGSCGLRERTGPGFSSYAIAGTVYDGQELDIACQTTGELVRPNRGTASNVWDKLTNGDYVSDVYVDTPGVGGGFSPPIPRC